VTFYQKVAWGTNRVVENMAAQAAGWTLDGLDAWSTDAGVNIFGQTEQVIT
jgi:hypothetical protein